MAARVLAMVAVCLAWLATPSGAGAATAIHIEVEGVINPVKARYVKQALERARVDGAEFVLLSLNTPGGLVSSMEEITTAITTSAVPVVGYVEPPTAQATSAGAFILLSTDVAAMAPGTRVGAAHPVGGEKPLEGVMDVKATNSLVSLAKALAERHHRPATFAEAIVRESASFTAEEAKKAGAVELIAATRGELLAALDGYRIDAVDRQVTLETRGIAIRAMPMSATNRLLDVLSDPTLASILLTLGVLGILYELSSPGVGLAGIVGTVCLLLALVALSTLPLKLGGFLLLIAGFTAIVVEVKAPSHGALAAGGVAALLLGGLVLVDESGYFGGAQKLDYRIFVPFVVVVSGVFFLFATVARRALGAPVQSGVEAMRGKRGHAKTRILPGPAGGIVFVDGSRWQVLSDTPVEEGEEVVVEEILTNPTRLKVRRTEKGAP
jgi:membrane-bound serine protease (ClpP class)